MIFFVVDRSRTMTQPTLVEEVDILQVVPMSLLCDQLEQFLAY